MEQSQGKGCCWLWRDRLRGCEGGDCDGKCLWRKAGQPWKQGNAAESHVGGGAITIAFLTPPTSIRGWNSRESDPSHTWGTELQSRPQPGDPSMCLMRQTTEKDPRQGIPLSAWMVRATKTGQRSLLIASYKSLKKKDSDRAITPVVDAVRVPAHLAPLGSPQAK